MYRKWLRVCIGVVLAGSISACATMSPIAGNFPPITPRQSQTGAENGKVVRWGGTIIHTQPEASQTCFQVLAFRLNSEGRPETGRGESDQGRFLACAPGFYDPELYSAGREVSFIGTITGVQTMKVGGFDYPYPKLEASRVYLWPLRPPERVSRTVYINSGFGWGWGGPYFWGGPGWWWGYP
ncbi:Slp family lipoprotein [Acidithiobacillus caldus]|jgi:outer membrane lipoprotein|uniref:Outer membrane lipoprotein Slp n=1 Tax=Acidithiobacillus caldus TaxID=33059 RepID=A0A1E7YZV3_9PROT|nr:Slp family lipoprotein [Acidithiobacillus caldus]OFC62060.1 hypothetical protein BAE30_03135 [Acidithiobacillus caldus]QER44305.1 outer membrane protein Slp [Acidithiobacillus caldus]WMT46749.1 MAG: Slp family lipoprotein [Acidithiobacillus caldus]